MPTIAETERLIIRRWTPDDAEAAFEMYGDPEVMRFLGGGKVQESVDSMRESLVKMIERMGDGPLGSFPLESKESGQVVGTILLKHLPESDKIEIGWHLPRKSWGKGYATEAAFAMLDYGFNQLALEVIYAVVFPENAKSIAVTQRLGMQPIGRTKDYYGFELEFFELKRARP